MQKRVVITGLGCVSPVGNNMGDTWAALLAGKSGAAPITLFDASHHKTKFAAEVKGFDAAALFGSREARKMDRFTQFATAATLEAISQAGLTIDESNHDRVGIVIGTGIGGIGTLLEQAEVMRLRGPDRVSPFLVPMMISDSAAGMIAIRIGARADERRWRVGMVFAANAGIQRDLAPLVPGAKWTPASPRWRRQRARAFGRNGRIAHDGAFSRHVLDSLP